jgi:hypothetical protein
VSPVLRLDLRFSRLFACAIIFIYGGALVITFFLPLSAALHFFLGLLLCASALQTWRQYPPQVLLLSGGEIIFRDGSASAILPHTFVHPALVVLCVSGQRARPIFPDALDADTFRRLCTHLRFGLASSIDAPPQGGL